MLNTWYLVHPKKVNIGHKIESLNMGCMAILIVRKCVFPDGDFGFQAVSTMDIFERGQKTWLD